MSDTFLIYPAKYFSMSRSLGIRYPTFSRSCPHNLRMVFTSVIRGAVENPLAYCVDVVLCKLIGSFRHHFALVGIRCDNFDEEKAGIRVSRLHAEKRRCVFFVGCTPNIHQLCKGVSCNEAKISFLSASVTGRRIAAFVKDLLLYGG